MGCEAIDLVDAVLGREMRVALEHRQRAPACPRHDDAGWEALHHAVACPGVAERVTAEGFWSAVDAGEVRGAHRGLACAFEAVARERRTVGLAEDQLTLAG